MKVKNNIVFYNISDKSILGFNEITKDTFTLIKNQRLSAQFHNNGATLFLIRYRNGNHENDLIYQTDGTIDGTSVYSHQLFDFGYAIGEESIFLRANRRQNGVDYLDLIRINEKGSEIVLSNYGQFPDVLLDATKTKVVLGENLYSTGVIRSSPSDVLAEGLFKNQTLIANISQYGEESYQLRFIQGVGTMVFQKSFSYPNNGKEFLWVTMGNGVTKLKTFKFIYEFLPFLFKNEAYFLAVDENNILGIWKTDGTVSGTIFVTNYDSQGWGDAVIVNNVLYFGGELNRSDGTQAGTYKILETKGIPILSLTNVGETLYFASYNKELWKYDISTNIKIHHYHQLSTNPLFTQRKLLKEEDNFKVCADGSEASVFKFSGGGYDYTQMKVELLGNPDNSINDAHLYGKTTVLSANSDSLVVRYKHPGYVGTNGDYSNGGFYLKNAATSEVIKQYTLQIYRGPLLMVHGKADKGSSYDIMYNKFKNEAFYQQDLMLKADYEKTHNEHFEVNKNVVKNHIDLLLANAVNKKYAAGKVDIVAHSMGGLLSRIYLQSNTYQNDINKLITHNTPHSGSQPANRLSDPIFFNTPKGQVAQRLGDWGGAAIDLQVGPIHTIATTINDAINLNKNKVPTHAIVTTHDYDPNDLINSPYPGATYAAMIKGLGMTPKELFRNDASDLVVAFESQTGGLTSSNTTIIPLQIHSQAQENLQLIDAVKVLIKSNPKGSYFAQNGYNPKMLEYVAPVETNLITNTTSNSTIHIQSPLETKIVNMGSPLQFEVNGTNLDSIIVYIKVKEGYWVELISQGNNLIKTTNIDSLYAVGKYKFLAVGYVANEVVIFKEGIFTVANCVESYPSLSGEINNPHYQSRNTIVANGKVVFGEKILMTSGKSIEFKPGFEADSYTRIEAQIKGCDGN